MTETEENSLNTLVDTLQNYDRVSLIKELLKNNPFNYQELAIKAYSKNHNIPFVNLCFGDATTTTPARIALIGLAIKYVNNSEKIINSDECEKLIMCTTKILKNCCPKNMLIYKHTHEQYNNERIDLVCPNIFRSYCMFTPDLYINNNNNALKQEICTKFQIDDFFRMHFWIGHYLTEQIASNSFSPKPKYGLTTHFNRYKIDQFFKLHSKNIEDFSKELALDKEKPLNHNIVKIQECFLKYPFIEIDKSYYYIDIGLFCHSFDYLYLKIKDIKENLGTLFADYIYQCLTYYQKKYEEIQVVNYDGSTVKNQKQEKKADFALIETDAIVIIECKAVKPHSDFIIYQDTQKLKQDILKGIQQIMATYDSNKSNYNDKKIYGIIITYNEFKLDSFENLLKESCEINFFNLSINQWDKLLSISEATKVSIATIVKNHTNKTLNEYLNNNDNRYLYPPSEFVKNFLSKKEKNRLINKLVKGSARHMKSDNIFFEQALKKTNNQKKYITYP